MAGESITFDFVGRGADQLSSQFRSIGGNAELAARGAAALKDAIAKQGDAAPKSAAQMSALTAAVRLFGDAEDKAAVKAIAADAAIKRLGDTAQDSGRKASGAGGGFGSLIGEITGFGAAADAASSGGSKFGLAMAGLNLASGVLEPAMAGVVVATAGLAAGFTAAAAGLGVFGLVAKSVYSSTSTAATAVQTAQIAYNAAIAAGVKPATAYRTEQQAIAKAYAQLSPAQIQLSKQIGDAQNTWQSFVASNTAGVATILTQGIGLLPKVFAVMQPFLAPVEKALSGIITQLGSGLSSAGFTSFIGALSQNAGPAITKIAAAIGNVVVGIGGILKAFLPVSQQMLTGLDKITAKFREWGTTLSAHSGFQSLMQTFRTETPQAIAILTNLGAILVNVGKAMFGLSTFSNSRVLLGVLLPLSGVLASLSRNTDLVRIALYALAAFKIGSAFSWIPGAWAGLVKFSAAAEGATVKEVIAAAATKVWAGAQAVLNAVMDANPIVLVAAAAAALGVAFYIAWEKSALFRDIMKDIAKAFLQAGIIIVEENKIIIGSFLNMVQVIITGAAKAFGWIPGLGGKLRGAAADFSTWRTGVNSDFDKVIAKMQSWQRGLDASKNTAASATQSIGSNIAGMGPPFTAAQQKVNALTQAFTRLPKNVAVSLTETGVGNFTITQGTSGHAGGTPTGGRPGAAAGLYVAAGSGPTADDVLIRASKGELVVPAHMVAGGAVDHLRGSIPGFASGGSIGPLAGQTTAFNAHFITTVTAAMEKAMTTAMKAAVATATAAATAAAGGGAGIGGVSNASGVAALKSAAAKHGWTSAAEWAALNYVEMREAGYSLTATNPSSGAYGMAQFINGPSEYAQYGGNSTTYAGQATAMANYIAQRYGDPIAAAAHERAYNWYDRGGWLKPGLTLAYNGTGRPEMVIPGTPGGSGAPDHLVARLDRLIAEVRQLTGVAASIPRATGEHVGAAVSGAAAAASFNRRYP